MASILCPFCSSGDRLNVCLCTWAVASTRMGLPEARRRFLAAGHTYPPLMIAPPKAMASKGLALRRVAVPKPAKSARDEGVSLTSVSPPKGPGVGRGRGRLHKAAIETVEIELSDPSPPASPKFDKKAWMKAYMVDYRKRQKQERSNG